MGKAAQWIKNFLTGKKERKNRVPTTPKEARSGPLPMPTPKERRRWSFRRSATGTALMEHKSAAAVRGLMNPDAAADTAAADVQQAAVIRLTATATETVEEDAAVKIQSVFRSYLARRALCALRGLVKMQALIRGDLVRRQTNTTLWGMQALVASQKRARVQRMQMLDQAEAAAAARNRQNIYWRSLHCSASHQFYETEENVKIVEMDHGERRDLKLPTCRGEVSPSRSNFTNISPRAISGRFEEYSFSRDESSPPHLSACSVQNPARSHRNYMANTESSRAKARSHSAPKQRPDSRERTPRRPSVDQRYVSGGVSRSSAGTDVYRSIKLDRSSASLQESVCGSASTVHTKYCRSLMAYDV